MSAKPQRLWKLTNHLSRAIVNNGFEVVRIGLHHTEITVMQHCLIEIEIKTFWGQSINRMFIPSTIFEFSRNKGINETTITTAMSPSYWGHRYKKATSTFSFCLSRWDWDQNILREQQNDNDNKRSLSNWTFVSKHCCCDDWLPAISWSRQQKNFLCVYYLIILSNMLDFIPFLNGLSRDRIILKSGL